MGSLSSSCCGNNHDPSSSKPVGASSGRKRSVLLLVAAVGLQLAFQFALAPWFVDHRDSWKTTVMRDSWLDGCSSSSSTIVNNTINNEEETILWNEEALMLLDSCVGRGGNYRIAFVTVLFFLLAALAAVCKPTANREAWPAKIVLYLLAVAGSIFLPNEPILTPIFLTIAIGKEQLQRRATTVLALFHPHELPLTNALYCVTNRSGRSSFHCLSANCHFRSCSQLE